MNAAYLTSTFKTMLAGIVHGHHAGYRLARTAIITRYYRSFFGLLWEFADPIVLALVFTLLHRSRALSAADFDAPYELFTLTGMMFWRTFTQALIQGLNSMSQFSRLRGGLRVRPESAILSIIYENMFTLACRVAILLVVIGWYGMLSPKALLLFFAALPLVLAFPLVVGFLLAPFNLVYRDIGQGMQVILWPLMFLSGVLLVLPPEGVMGALREYNPTAVLIYNLRSLLLFGTLDTPQSFLVLTLATGFGGLLAWYVYHVTFDMAGEMQ